MFLFPVLVVRDIVRTINYHLSFNLMYFFYFDRRMLKAIARVKRYIENIEYSHNPTLEGMQIVDYVKRNCPDKGVHDWLDNRSRAAQFLNLLSLFCRELKEEIQRRLNQREDVDIVFCGHGSIIGDIRYPAGCLTLLSTIEDVVLYSPWNCAVNAKVVYGIATGAIQPSNRAFIPEHNRPPTLPPRWNSMRNARTQQIPEIMFKPVGQEERAWQDFLSLGTVIGRNRIFLPYVRPADADPLFFPETPFFVLTLALSVVLMVFTDVKATIHLAACLGRDTRSPFTPDLFHHLQRQYACTIDNTVMSNSGDVQLNSQMYRALRDMFG